MSNNLYVTKHEVVPIQSIDLNIISKIHLKLSKELSLHWPERRHGPSTKFKVLLYQIYLLML